MPELDQKKLCRAEFTCEAPNASSVFLIGTFNDSNMRSTPMNRGDGGEWTVVLQLPPGQYQYKFIVVYHGQMNVRNDGPYGTMNHVVALFTETAGSAA